MEMHEQHFAAKWSHMKLNQFYLLARRLGNRSA